MFYRILFTNPNFAGEEKKIAETTVMTCNKWLLKKQCFHSAKGKEIFGGLISGALEKNPEYLFFLCSCSYRHCDWDLFFYHILCVFLVSVVYILIFVSFMS